MKTEFIAEIGLNYNGNFDLIYELIRQAKYSGANVVKFQLGWRSGKGEINQLDKEKINKLKLWADYFEIELLFSVFNKEALELIKPFNIDRFKIASRTVKDDLDLVKEIVDIGKPTIISLGMWDKTQKPILGYENVKYLWCKSIYPSTPWDILDMPKDFIKSNFDGYSDHSIGIDSALLAIARGAKIIEKHFTLEKSNTSIRDHALSASPEEFNQMTQIGREMSKKVSLGV
jgi:N,N'-diacetyllegionaminate synthase